MEPYETKRIEKKEEEIGEGTCPTVQTQQLYSSAIAEHLGRVGQDSVTVFTWRRIVRAGDPFFSKCTLLFSGKQHALTSAFHTSFLCDESNLCLLRTESQL